MNKAEEGTPTDPQVVLQGQFISFAKQLELMSGANNLQVEANIRARRSVNASIVFGKPITLQELERTVPDLVEAICKPVSAIAGKERPIQDARKVPDFTFYFNPNKSQENDETGISVFLNAGTATQESLTLEVTPKLKRIHEVSTAGNDREYLADHKDAEIIVAEEDIITNAFQDLGRLAQLVAAAHATVKIVYS